MNDWVGTLVDAFPAALMTIAALGFVFGTSAIWRRKRQKAALEVTPQLAGFYRGGFTDGNHRVCRPPELVEYQFGDREGVMVEVFPDGDVVVFFKDTLRFETVKQVHLNKLQKPARWACAYGFHVHCVSDTGILGDTTVCLGCGFDRRKFSGLYNLRRIATPQDKRRIAELRGQQGTRRTF